MATATAPPPAPESIADWPFEFEIVPIKYLKVDEYQRPLTSFVDRIVKNFNPALVGCLCLSKRSNTHYAVIDGQTRGEGMRQLGMESAPAVVFYGLTREQEAELFSLFQTERRGMTSAARFNAQVIAKDDTALAIAEVVESLGYVIDHNNNAPGAIRAVAAVEYVFHGARSGTRAKKTQHPGLLSMTLETIKSAWPKLPDTAKSASMIRGLGYYLADKQESVDQEKLALKLAKVTPAALAKRAEALREGRGMSGNSPAHMAEAIEAQYRKK